MPVDVDPARVDWERCDVIGIRQFRDGYCNRRESHALIVNAWPKGFEKIITIHRRGNAPESDGTKPKHVHSTVEWKDLPKFILPSHDQSRWFDCEEYEKVLHTWEVDEVPSKAEWFRAECRRREWDYGQYLKRGTYIVISTYAKYELGLALLDQVEPSDRYTFRSYMRGWALLGLGREEEAQGEWQNCLTIAQRVGAAVEKMEEDFTKARNIIESHRKAAEFYKSRPDLKKS